jgi:hypothetical protein
VLAAPISASALSTKALSMEALSMEALSIELGRRTERQHRTGQPGRANRCRRGYQLRMGSER